MKTQKYVFTPHHPVYSWYRLVAVLMLNCVIIVVISIGPSFSSLRSRSKISISLMRESVCVGFRTDLSEANFLQQRPVSTEKATHLINNRVCRLRFFLIYFNFNFFCFRLHFRYFSFRRYYFNIVRLRALGKASSSSSLYFSKDR